MWITPYRQDTDLKTALFVDDKITIFYEQTDGWQLRIADLVINGGTGLKNEFIPPIFGAGFAALYIVMSYFELIAKYMNGYTGTGQSERYFKEGVFTVFPSLREAQTAFPEAVNGALKVLYKEVRCGLYHAGRVGGGIVLTGESPNSVRFDPSTSQLVLNPHLLVPELRRNLTWYVTRLKDINEKELRENFEKRFDHDYSSRK